MPARSATRSGSSGDSEKIRSGASAQPTRYTPPIRKGHARWCKAYVQWNPVTECECQTDPDHDYELLADYGF